MTRLKMALGTLILLLVCASGCGRRVVLVPPGEPVRLREKIKSAKVWARDKDNKEIPGTVDLPEGWFCLPDPGPEPKR